MGRRRHSWVQSIVVIKKVKELNAGEPDKIVKMPQCEAMDDDEVNDKAEILFFADKITF